MRMNLPMNGVEENAGSQRQTDLYQSNKLLQLASADHGYVTKCRLMSFTLTAYSYG